MKLTFHSVRAKNFLQIGNDFATFNLQKSPFTVIVGKNGSGKSTILDLLTYVLYNKAYRPKVTLGQLVNSVNKKQMLVEIAFTAGASNYVIRRGEKPKVFEIYRNKELIKPDPSIGDMQTYLEENILNQNYKTFCQINVIGKATYKQFMTLTPAERRAVVEDILDSNIYSVMASLGKEDYKTLSKTIDENGRDIQIVMSKIENTRAMIKRYEQDRSEQISIINEQIINAEGDESNLRSSISLLEIEIEEKREALEKIIPIQHKERLNQEIMKTTSAIGGHQNTIAKAKQTLDKINTMMQCPHCLQDVDENHKLEIAEQATKEIQEAEVEIVALKQKQNKFTEVKQKYDKVQEEYRKYQNELSNYRVRLASTSTSIEGFRDQIQRLSTIPAMDDLPSLDQLNDELTSIIESRDANSLKQSKLKAAIELLGDNGIKAKLIGKYIPAINKSVNDYLERMNMFVEFTLDSEFNETINAINRQSFTYHSFSEGQKMRIDLAILLTWRKIAQLRNSMTTNLFMLDEIADGSLDQEGMDEFISILKEVSDAQNTFLISHKDSTIDMFDNVIRAETVGNFTRYTEE